MNLFEAHSEESEPRGAHQTLVNLFSPRFGGTPDSFFGREEVVVPFVRALGQRGSDWRSLFITGPRGLGKTTLIEHLSGLASDEGWTVYDLPPYDTVAALRGQMLTYDEVTTIDQPEAGFNFAGMGFSMGGVGTASTRHLGELDLTSVFVETCRKAKRGVLVTIDEVQKVPIDDCALICSAFQMASRKGYDVALTIAGLPYSFDDVSADEGCSFMRRSKHVKLQLMGRDEIHGAFVTLSERLQSLGVTLGANELRRMVDLSKGQPFLVQLLGFALVNELIDELDDGTNRRANPYLVTDADVDLAFDVAMEGYEARALEPILTEAGPVGRRYLQAMAQAMGEGCLIANSGEVAELLGRTARSLGPVRARLLRLGIIVAPQRGTMRFNIPYLREYLANQLLATDSEARLDEWEV